MNQLKQELGPMLRLALPLVFAEIGWMAMGVVDTIMVGRLPESATAIGAVSLGSVVYFAVAIFGTGLLLGLDTLVSQSFGAGRLADCRQSLLNGVYLSLPLAPLLMGVVWLVMPLLPLFGVHPALVRATIPYMSAVNWSLPPLLLFTAFRRYLQAIDVVKPIAFALITANLMNALANWLLIFGHLGAPALGVQGAGWATCISRAYMATVLLAAVLYSNRRQKVKPRPIPIRPDLKRIRALVRLGFPAAAQVTLEVAVFALATVLVGKLGPAAAAGHHIALMTVSCTFMVPLGVSSAAAVRVGQALGRHDAAGASRAGWAAMALGAGFMFCAALSLWLFPRQISRVFSGDEAVIQTGISLLFVAAFFQLFDGIQIVATGALRGAGDTRTPMISHLLAYWGLGLPVGYWLCFGMGLGAIGIWIGLSAALIVIGLVLLVAWRQKVHSLSSAAIAVPAQFS